MPVTGNITSWEQAVRLLSTEGARAPLEVVAQIEQQEAASAWLMELREQGLARTLLTLTERIIPVGEYRPGGGITIKVEFRSRGFYGHTRFDYSDKVEYFAPSPEQVVQAFTASRKDQPTYPGGVVGFIRTELNVIAQYVEESLKAAPEVPIPSP